jgi:hypothetical protein
LLDFGGVNHTIKVLPRFAITLLSSALPYAAHFTHAQLMTSPADGGVINAPPSDSVFEFTEAVKFHEAFIKKCVRSIRGLQVCRLLGG